jgi:hypothetical protein
MGYRSRHSPWYWGVFLGVWGLVLGTTFLILGHSSVERRISDRPNSTVPAIGSCWPTSRAAPSLSY